MGSEMCIRDRPTCARPCVLAVRQAILNLDELLRARTDAVQQTIIVLPIPHAGTSAQAPLASLVVSVHAVEALRSVCDELALRTVRVHVHDLELSAAASHALGAPASSALRAGRGGSAADARVRVNVSFPAPSMVPSLSTPLVPLLAVDERVGGPATVARFAYSARAPVGPAQAAELRAALASVREGEADALFLLVHAREDGEAVVGEAFVDLAQLAADGRDMVRARIELVPVDASGRRTVGDPLGTLTVSLEAAAALRSLTPR